MIRVFLLRDKHMNDDPRKEYHPENIPKTPTSTPGETKEKPDTNPENIPENKRY